MLLLLYTAQLGRFPPVFELDLAQAVVIFLAAVFVSVFLLLALAYPAVVAFLADSPGRRPQSKPRQRELWWWVTVGPLVLAVPLFALLGALWEDKPLLVAAGTFPVLGAGLMGACRRASAGRHRRRGTGASAPGGPSGERRGWEQWVDRRMWMLSLAAPAVLWLAVLPPLWLLFLRAFAAAGWASGFAAALMALSSAIVSLLAARMPRAWHEARSAGAPERRMRSRAVWTYPLGGFCIVTFLATVLGPGPRRLLDIGRYDASCLVEARGVQLLAELDAGGEVREHCRPRAGGRLCRCELHVWWGAGEEWLVSLGRVPLWLWPPEQQSGRILPLRLVRACVRSDGHRLPDPAGSPSDVGNSRPGEARSREGARVARQAAG